MGVIEDTKGWIVEIDGCVGIDSFPDNKKQVIWKEKNPKNKEERSQATKEIRKTKNEKINKEKRKMRKNLKN